MPSFGTVGDCYDNSMMESFWSSVQIEMLNRKKLRTSVDLANAIFDYIEIFYNRRRRHSQLGYSTPIEHELRFNQHPSPPDLHTVSGNQTVGQVRVKQTDSSPVHIGLRSDQIRSDQTRPDQSSSGYPGCPLGFRAGFSWPQQRLGRNAGPVSIDRRSIPARLPRSSCRP